MRATGDEPFDSVAEGEAVLLTADPGEVLWRDDAGVTCRRWNWRQCVRTRLGEQTSNILFILDGLQPVSTENLEAAGSALIDALTAADPEATAASRLLGVNH